MIYADFLNINVCRLIFKFVPNTGGSTIHTAELSQHIAPYLNKQIIVTSKEDAVTTVLDNSFAFDIHRVNYCKFRLLNSLKRRYISCLPVAHLVNASFIVAAVWECVWLNRKYHFDIIHGHGVNAGVAATIVGWLIKRPTVWMLHGSLKAYNKAGEFYESLLSKIFTPDHLFVLNDGSEAPDKFRKLISRNITTVYHGINTAHFAPCKQRYEPSRILERHYNEFIILCPHSLIPIKGVEHAIHVFSVFIEQNGIENARLIIVGDGTSGLKLKKLVRYLGIGKFIYFTGAIKNTFMPDYYRLSDVVVATSLYSNMNRVVLEAMACGKPVVAFSSGRTRDVIFDNVTGLLAESGDNQAFADNLCKLYRNPNLRNSLGYQARSFVKTNRNWETRIKIEL